MTSPQHLCACATWSSRRWSWSRSRSTTDAGGWSANAGAVAVAVAAVVVKVQSHGWTSRQPDRLTVGRWWSWCRGGTLLQRVVLIDFVAVSSVGKQTTRAWATNLVEHKWRQWSTPNTNPNPIPGYAKQLPNIRGQIWLVLISDWQAGRRRQQQFHLAPSRPGIWVCCVVLWCCGAAGVIVIAIGFFLF